LNHILSQIIRCDENSIRDSNEFAKFIQNFEISEDEIMASLDIINLFTNIPIEFTLKLIEKRIKNYTNLNDITDLNTVEIVSLLEFCMKNNIISFNNKFSLQIFGAPMGSSLSPIVAEALVQYIFKTAISTFHNPPRVVEYIFRKNGKLETKVYRKPTHSNRYLNFHSYHSIENKKSVIRT
jgi:hypothetical protein